jgi:hypothetical protein
VPDRLESHAHTAEGIAHATKFIVRPNHSFAFVTIENPSHHGKFFALCTNSAALGWTLDA